MKNYLEQVKEAVEQYIRDNDVRLEEYDGPEEAKEELEDALWAEDSVTGNGSGSYTFNRQKAKEYVLDDFDTVAEALLDFCCDNMATVGDHFVHQNWEWMDVIARRYVLPEAVAEVVDEFNDSLDF